jgi:hypothetical protein
MRSSRATTRVKIGFVVPRALCDAGAAFVSQELYEKTPPKHGRVLICANLGALQDSG